MINNFLNGNLPPPTVSRILTLVEQISTDLPFMISLTPEERRLIPSVANARLPYVLKLVEYCKKHRAKIGLSQEDLDELVKYAQLFDDLTKILAVVEDLRTGLRDTKMQMSAILFRLSRANHAIIEVAYAKGKPGLESIILELDKLFENQGNTSSSEDEEGLNEPKDKGPEGSGDLVPA